MRVLQVSFTLQDCLPDLDVSSSLSAAFICFWRTPKWQKVWVQTSSEPKKRLAVVEKRGKTTIRVTFCCWSRILTSKGGGGGGASSQSRITEPATWTPFLYSSRLGTSVPPFPSLPLPTPRPVNCSSHHIINYHGLSQTIERVVNGLS